MELPKEEGGDETYLSGIFLPENVEFTPQHRVDFLGGLTVLNGQALTFDGAEQFVKANPGADTPSTTEGGALYQPIQPRDFTIPTGGTVELTLIPYYAWANRGIAYMDVWMSLATQDQLAAQRSVAQKIQQRNAAELPAALRHSAFDIREYGTVGDGPTFNTATIQKTTTSARSDPRRTHRPGPTTHRGLSGRSLWREWVRSFYSSAPAVVATSG